MKGQRQLFSHKKDNWRTPKKLFEELNKEFHFTVDAAADESNHLCANWWGPQSPIPDSLQHNWKGEICWLNPPYSMVKEFVEKATIEAISHDVKTVMLVPARTDTKWWHSFVWDTKNNKFYDFVEVRFLKGRVKFEDENGAAKNSAPFPSVILIFF